MSIVDIILIAAVALLLFAAFRYTVKKMKGGGCVGCSGCGKGTGTCPHCHSEKEL